MSTGYRSNHNHLTNNLQQVFVAENPKIIG